MARLRTRMSKIKEVLRLKFDCHLSNRSIAVCLNLSTSLTSFGQKQNPAQLPASLNKNLMTAAATSCW